VLHVEDDGDLHRLICAVGSAEAKFDAARSLAEAREKLNQFRYDMILLDLKLPDGSGWELLAQLEGLDPPPPVLVLSAEELGKEQKALVQAALVKSHTSSQHFLNTLKRLVARDTGTETN
jgi:DNA-binding response OmpR family regulator